MNISLQTRQSLNLLANKMCNLLAYNCIICQQNMQLHNLLAYKMWCFFQRKSETDLENHNHKDD